MSPVKIGVRVDASTLAGLGHLMRCRTLALALRQRQVKVRFICRAHPGNQIEALRAEGFEVAVLPAPTTWNDTEGDYADWLGVPKHQDAHETIHVIKDGGAILDWLIVDHYALDAEWESALRPWARHVLVIDDLADRSHDCDLLLDQNYVEGGETRYLGLIPRNARALLGPNYALLRPEYLTYRNGEQSQARCSSRVFVFFGGTDPDNLTGSSLEALSDAALEHLECEVVIGANNPRRASLMEQAAARYRTRVHSPRPHLADLMASCDLALGAGGTTTWERCCLGLPSIVVSIAENQRLACEALADAGVIVYAGHHPDVSVETIREATAGLVDDTDALRRLSSAGRQMVDGFGTQRVIDALNLLDA